MQQSSSKAINRVLIFIYAILALAAVGRSSFELATKFSEAPLPYSLSALAALVYVFVTWSMIKSNTKLATILLALELLFVLVVGFSGIFDPSLFPKKTVWTGFGAGYGYFPLFMPIVGLVQLNRRNGSK